MSIDKVLENLRKPNMVAEKATKKVNGPDWKGPGRMPMSIKLSSPAVVRLAMITAHYRAPMSWDAYPARLREAENAWVKMAKAAEQCDDDPPDDVVSAVREDMNTPRALVAIERYVRAGEGRKVYAAMKFLGIAA